MPRAEGINKLRRKRRVDRLIVALSRQELVHDSDNGVLDLRAQDRADAIVALGQLEELDDERAIEAMMRRFDDPVPWVRETAVRTLGARQPERVLEGLIHGLISWPEPPYGNARMEALRALRQLDDSSVAERLIKAIAASNGSAVLDRITLGAVEALTADASKSEEIVSLLMDMLRGAGGDRSNLEILLAWMGDYGIDELIAGLDDPLICESAATILGALREARAVPALVHCLEDGRPHVRLAAARALGEIRDVRAVEGLMRAVADEEYDVRRQAQEALDALGSVGVVAGVSAVLQLMMNGHAAELPSYGPEGPPSTGD